MRTVKSAGPLKIASAVASEGKPRYRKRHTEHRPCNVPGQPESQAKKVERMAAALRERGWTIEFQVLAVSARGFSYAGSGASPAEAFLKALGQWKKDVSSALPKAANVVAEVRQPPVAVRAAPRQEPDAYLSEMVRDLLREHPVAV